MAATPSGSRRICCAARRRRRRPHDVAGRDRRQPARACTRARRRSSCTWRRGSRRASGSRASAREMDGKSIMGILLLAAARGSTITITADGADERDAVEALVGAGRSRDSARTHAAPDRHRRLAGRRRGPRGHPDPARAGAALPDRAGARSSTSWGGSTRAARRSREQLVDIRARVARRGGPSWRRSSTRSC